MSVQENDWIWDALLDYVECGFISEKEARAMSLEEAYVLVSDESNKRTLAHYKKYGITEAEAEREMAAESYRW